MTEATLDASLCLAVLAARRAARLILEVYQGAFSVDTKEDRTPITEADRRADRLIAELLRAQSGLPVLSEEGRDIPYRERRHWSAFWLVDPLDGTKEFIKHNGEFTVNIALLEGRAPILGIVYAPVPDLLYFAHRGIGSHKLEGLVERLPEAVLAGEGCAASLLRAARKLAAGAPLELREKRRRPRLTVASSRSHGGWRLQRYLESLGRYAEQVEVRRLGSALKACLVAEGVADIYPRFGRTMEWDTAAAHAVVLGVGKRMVAYGSGRELAYNKPRLVNPSFLVY